jgi:hypothetical protein
MSPIEFWRDQGTGIMIMVRQPSGSEVVYVGGQQYGTADPHDIGLAIKFLHGLLIEQPNYSKHTGGCGE